MSQALRSTAALLLAVAPLAVPLDAQARAPRPPRWIVVSNEHSRSLSLVDGATLRVEATIPVPGRARGVRTGPGGRTVLVALSSFPPGRAGPDDAIVVVDLAARRVVRRYQAGTDPEQFAITPDGRRIVAANEDAGTASTIDPATGQVRATLVVGTEPEGVTISPDGRWAYVTAETSNTVAVIDVAKEKVVATFLVGARPRDTAFSRDGRFAYVTGEVGGTISRIDARRHRVLSSARIGSGDEKPVGVAVSPDGRRVYLVTGAAHALVALDAATLREVGRVAIGRRPWGLGLSPDGRYAYTANGRSDSMSVVDLATMTVVQSVAVGTRPWGIAIVP